MMRRYCKSPPFSTSYFLLIWLKSISVTSPLPRRIEEIRPPLISLHDLVHFEIFGLETSGNNRIFDSIRINRSRIAYNFNCLITKILDRYVEICIIFVPHPLETIFIYFCNFVRCISCIHFSNFYLYILGAIALQKI
jgi:hypothetical protein